MVLCIAGGEPFNPLLDDFMRTITLLLDKVDKEDMEPNCFVNGRLGVVQQLVSNMLVYQHRLRIHLKGWRGSSVQMRMVSLRWVLINKHVRHNSLNHPQPTIYKPIGLHILLVHLVQQQHYCPHEVI